MTPACSTDAVRVVLSAQLPGPIAAIERRPSPYRTSHELEEVDVRLADGRMVALVLKAVGPGSLTPAARAAKPAFLQDPLREVEVYERLLGRAPPGTARHHGTVLDDTGLPCGLLLERMAGVGLREVGARSTWEHVAGWLARMHQTLRPHAGACSRLLHHDAAYLRRWPERAAAHATSSRSSLRAIGDRYDAVLERLAALPAGPVHGEFYASNVLVDDPAAPRRVCAVDWEMAGVGPQLADLAALTSGRWSDDDRRAIAAAYQRAVPARARMPDDVFEQGLTACRLHVALQWLGWSPSWTPPEEHRTDWLQEALRMAGLLGL